MPNSRNSPDNVFDMYWHLVGLKSCVDKPRRNQTKSESTPAADKCVEKECFEYMPNVGALQKSHVLKFQKRSWNRIGDSEFNFTIMIAFLHATKAEPNVQTSQRPLPPHKRTTSIPRASTTFRPTTQLQRVQADKVLASDVDPVCSIDDWPKSFDTTLNLHGTHATAGILLQITVTQPSNAFYRGGPSQRSQISLHIPTPKLGPSLPPHNMSTVKRTAPTG